MALISIRREGPITLLGLDRPDKLNALDQALCDEVTAALAELANEPSILVIHSTTPGMFVAGADIAELLERDAEIGMRGVNAMLFERLEERRWPTIAAIDGAALGGGCELALACDLRVASERSKFGQPELGLGILAGAGGNWRLAQAVGVPMARRLLYTGQIIGAAEAHAAGLVGVFADPALGGTGVYDYVLNKVGDYDMTAQALLFESEDKKARMTAFLDERRRRREARERQTKEGSA